jgi:cysteine-rich repeat protein
MRLSVKHMLLVSILGFCACTNPPPHLILVISDTENLSQDADGVALGESLTAMKHFELGETGLPLTLTLRSKDNGERNLWVESRKGDDVLARGRIKVRFRRKKSTTYTVSLWHSCVDDGTNDGAMCSLSDPDLGRGECVAGLCSALECGDGIVGLDETCDDGNQLAGDYCSADCLTVIGSCGDGTRQDNEICEDANTQDDDYCSADCLTVTGLCGDNIQQGNEACDDGNTQEGDYCAADCQTVTGYCGDAMVQTGEDCDDGNNVGDDYCSEDCSATLGFCGDSVLQSIEACDDGGPTSGNDDGCPADCLTVDSGWLCSTVGASCSEICGDGLKVGEEVCDDANTSTHDGCAEDCRSIQSGWQCLVEGVACTLICGDGIEVVNENECDDGNTVTETCTYGSMDACTVCDASCQEAAGALSYCGDGDVDAADGGGVRPRWGNYIRMHLW